MCDDSAACAANFFWLQRLTLSLVIVTVVSWHYIRISHMSLTLDTCDMVCHVIHCRCPHCQQLAPVFDAAAAALAPHAPPRDPAVRLLTVDCTVAKSVCEKYEAHGYPTILWMKCVLTHAHACAATHDQPRSP